MRSPVGSAPAGLFIFLAKNLAHRAADAGGRPFPLQELKYDIAAPSLSYSHDLISSSGKGASKAATGTCGSRFFTFWNIYLVNGYPDYWFTSSSTLTGIPIFVRSLSDNLNFRRLVYSKMRFL